MKCFPIPPYPSWYSDKKIRKKERKRMKAFWSRTNNYGSRLWWLMNVESQFIASPFSPLNFDRVEAAREKSKTHYKHFFAKDTEI